MKHVIALTLFSLLAGCVTVPPIAVPNLDKSATVIVKDSRPAREKESKIFSLLVTSDQYGLSRERAETLSPPITRLLQHRVYETLPQNSQPIAIQINHLVVYRNMQSAGRRMAVGGMFGALGGLAAGATQPDGASGASSLIDAKLLDSDDQDEWKLAIYAKSENPTDAAALIVYADTVIDGKRVATRTVYPIPKDRYQQALPDAVDRAINYHVQQYVKG